MVLTGHKVNQNILAVRMVCPVYFTPGKVYLIGASLTQCVLTKEEHIPSTIFIHRSTMFLHERNTFNDVCELDLFVTGQLRDAHFCQLLVDRNRRLFTKDFIILILFLVIVQIRAWPFFYRSTCCFLLTLLIQKRACYMNEILTRGV